MDDTPMTLSDRLRMEAAQLNRADETDVFMEAAAEIERLNNELIAANARNKDNWF